MALAGLIITVGLIGGLNDASTWNKDAPLAESRNGEQGTSNGTNLVGQVDAEANRWTDATAVPGRSVEEVRAATTATGTAQRLLWSTPYATRNVGATEDWEAAQAIICAEGTPWPCDWALAVVYGGSAHCPFGESGGNPLAWATEIVDGVRYYFHGLFQLISTSPDPGPLADPVYNTERAAEKYRSEKGVGHWPGCP